MNIRELTYVALKVTGIVSLLFAVRILGSTAYAAALLTNDSYNGWWFLIVTLIPFVFTMLITYLLLAQTNRVIEWISLPDEESTNKEIRIEAFLSGAFAIVAIILIINSFSKLIAVPHFIQTYLESVDPSTGQKTPWLLSAAIQSVIEIFIRLTLGLYLFFGGDVLVRFWKKYRDRKVLID